MRNRISNSDLASLTSDPQSTHDDYMEFLSFDKPKKFNRSSAHGRDSYMHSRYRDKDMMWIHTQREDERRALLNPVTMKADYEAMQAVEVVELESMAQVSLFGKLLAWFRR